MRYTVIYNDSAGNDDNSKIAHQFLEAAQPKHQVTLKRTASRSEAISYIYFHRFELENIVVIGGDGSINTIFSALIGSKRSIPIGIIPGGTSNNFAQAMNIPMDAEEAIHNILNPHIRKFSLVHTSNRAIVSSLTLGAMADIAYSIRDNDKHKWGPLIYVFKGFKYLLSQKSYKITVNTDNNTHKFRTHFLLITTTKSIGGFTHFDDRSGSVDGKAHVTILKSFSLLRLVGYFSYFISGQLKRRKDIQYLSANHISIDNDIKDQEIPVRIDGDPAEFLPVKIDVENNFLQIIVPKKE